MEVENLLQLISPDWRVKVVSTHQLQRCLMNSTDSEDKDTQELLVEQLEEALKVAKSGKMHSLFFAFTQYEEANTHEGDCDTIVVPIVCSADTEDITNALILWGLLHAPKDHAGLPGREGMLKALLGVPDRHLH